MPSRHKVHLKRNRRRQRALLHKAEERKHLQESAKIILAEADLMIARLVKTIAALDKARTDTLIRTLAATKNN